MLGTAHVVTPLRLTTQPAWNAGLRPVLPVGAGIAARQGRRTRRPDGFIAYMRDVHRALGDLAEIRRQSEG